MLRKNDEGSFGDRDSIPEMCITVLSIDLDRKCIGLSMRESS